MFLTTLNMKLLTLILLAGVGSTVPHHQSVPAWEDLAHFPLLPRQEHTTVFIPPSTIAILGGVVPCNSSFPPVETTSLMQFYSIVDNSWSRRANIPRGLNHLNAAVVDGKLYVLGGLAEASVGQRAWRSVADSWVYEPSTDSWANLPGVPTGEERGSAAVGVYNEKIYLAAGLSELELFPNGSQQSVSVVSVFDTKTWTWLPIPDAAKYIPEARDHAGAAVVGSKMYILGGRRDGQKNVRDTVFILDLCKLENGWKTSSARMPTPRGSVAAGVIGERVYILGGEGNIQVESGVFDQVEAYDTRKDSWESVGKMRIPRHGSYAVGVGGMVYVPGGGVNQGAAPVAMFDAFHMARGL